MVSGRGILFFLKPTLFFGWLPSARRSLKKKGIVCYICTWGGTPEYKHFHIALMFQRPAKIAKASKHLLKEVRTWPRDSEETRQPDVGAYYFPIFARVSLKRDVAPKSPSRIPNALLQTVAHRRHAD